jgi:hypothetical protein
MIFNNECDRKIMKDIFQNHHETFELVDKVMNEHNDMKVRLAVIEEREEAKRNTLEGKIAQL